jgi:hypothetical protein
VYAQNEIHKLFAIQELKKLFEFAENNLTSPIIREIFMQPNGDSLRPEKQGNAKSIEAILNDKLKARNITAKAILRDNCLQIMLESEQELLKTDTVNKVKKLLTKINPQNTQRVRVYSKQTGDDFPRWNEDFELEKAVEPIKSGIQITKELNLDASLKALAKNGNVVAIASLIDNQLQDKNVKTKVSLRNGLLQVVMVYSNIPVQESQENSVQLIHQILKVINSALIKTVKIKVNQAAEDYKVNLNAEDYKATLGVLLKNTEDKKNQSKRVIFIFVAGILVFSCFQLYKKVEYETKYNELRIETKATCEVSTEQLAKVNRIQDDNLAKAYIDKNDLMTVMSELEAYKDIKLKCDNLIKKMNELLNEN